MKKLTFSFTIGLTAICINAFAQTNLLQAQIQQYHGTLSAKLHNKHSHAEHKPMQAMGYIAKYDSIYYWVWDTLTLKNWFTHAFQKDIHIVYDANNNQVSKTTQTWKSFVWSNSNHYIRIFDANNNMTSETTQTWNGSIWLNSSKDSMTYDIHHNNLTSLYQSWVGGVWVNNSLYIWTYDTKNNQTSQLVKSWSSGTWVNYSLDTYTYDASNNKTGSLSQTWSGSVWTNSTKDSITFDTHNNVINAIFQYWSGSAWVNSQINTSTYTYNTGNLETSGKWNTWTTTGSSSGRDSIIYDVNNNQIRYLGQMWNGSKWLNIEKDTMTYDANNNQLSQLQQNWSGSSWVNNWKFTSTYDINNLTLTYVRKHYDNNDTAGSGDSVRYYFHDILGINNLLNQPGKTTIYPNPNNGKFTIALSAIKENSLIEIYNMLGEKIYTAKLNATNTQIDLNNNASGIYLYRVLTETGDLLSEGKLIIQK
jgi:hypothetical protein